MESGFDYEGAKEFSDPILRCSGCRKLVHRKYASKFGGCSHCGFRQFTNVQGISGEEMASLRDGTFNFELKKDAWYPIDETFFKLFAPASEVEVDDE